METQTMIDQARLGDLSAIRAIVDCKNQKIYFEAHKHLPLIRLQSHALAMLFVCLENNSDLLFGALRHLNVLHKLYPETRFLYNNTTLDDLDFHNSIASSYMDDFFMTIGSCVDSPFNGARTEALSFFEYWIQDNEVADTIFTRIITVWPWTNRNKYYFLSILFDRHGFAALLQRNPNLHIDINEFMSGLAISLQYRNLISPGQTLVITLTRQQIPETFHMISTLLQGNNFQMTNCLNHWMRCISNTDRVFNLLKLSRPDLLVHKKFSYLQENHLHCLILFRSCFKTHFANSSNVFNVDALIMANVESWNKPENKLALLDIILTKTMGRPSELNDNLPVLERALKANMCDISSALRNDVLKMFPNLMYLMAPIIKEDINTPRIRQFFKFVREEIFEYAIQIQHEYQPLIYALRIYEIILKTLYGSRTDRLIKRFNPDVNDRLKKLLVEDNVWPLITSHTYEILLQLLRSEFNDVRDISCELFIRFFPQQSILEQCKEAIAHQDFNRCAYAHYLGRIVIHTDDTKDSAEFYCSLREYLRANLKNYSDPLLRIRSGGGHLYGALNCLNEFYSREASSNVSERSRGECQVFSNAELVSDIRLAVDVVSIMLGFFQFGVENSDHEWHGSPSFEKMDESLSMLIEKSEYRLEDETTVSKEEAINIREKEKKLLLKSIWTSLKAACDLASNIGVYLLDHPTLQDNDYEHLINQCYQLSIRVLVQCRHKGAIEAAGLSLGKLVASITSRFTVDSTMFTLLVDSVTKLFGVVSKTDTTRRGAGFSIMVLHLVKSDRNKSKPLLRQVMQILLAQGTEMQATITNSCRDNTLASVLHFLCVLVKDGDLRLALTEYTCAIFEINLATINSKEWVVRNASLQLFGAFVPKLVGQSQFFISDLSWEPVHILYTDIRLKMNRMHQQILALLQHENQSTIVITTILQLLSRVETIDTQDPADAMLKSHFFRCLHHPNMKVRELAALCLTNVHKFYEIPNFLLSIVPHICHDSYANSRHGLLCTMEHMLAKYESDERFMPLVERQPSLGETLQKAFRMHWRGWPLTEPGRFYLLGKLFRILTTIGSDTSNDLMLDIMFGDMDSRKSVADHVNELYQVKSHNFGFHAWYEIMVDAYVKKSTPKMDDECTDCVLMDLRRTKYESI